MRNSEHRIRDFTGEYVFMNAWDARQFEEETGLQPLESFEARGRISWWMNSNSEHATLLRRVILGHATARFHFGGERAIEDAFLIRWKLFKLPRRERQAVKVADLAAGASSAYVPPPPANTETPPEKTWFEVKVIDEFGKPVDGAELIFSQNTTQKKIKTNGSGIARWQDVEGPSFASARLAAPDAVREFLKPRWDAGGKKAKVPDEAVVIPVRPGGPVSLEAETPSTIVLVRSAYRARLIGFHFDTSKCFLLPEAMKGIRGVKRLYDRHPDAEMLVLGHTDAAGKPAYNDTLSLERARAIVAYLTDDVDGWISWFEPGKPAEKRWGTLEVQRMLSALPEGEATFYQGKPNGAKDARTRESVKAFQRWSNETRGTTLDVDGNAGSETRRALVAAYMAFDDTTLPKGATITAHGAGESFPEDPTPDGVADPDNRRVEVFVFDDGVHPPPPGDILKPASTERDEWLGQVVDTLDVEHQGCRVRVVEPTGHVVANATVRLVGPHSDESISDAMGLATFMSLPSGSYKVQAIKDGYLLGETPFVYPPDPLAEAALDKPEPIFAEAKGEKSAFAGASESAAETKSDSSKSDSPKSDVPPTQDVVVVVTPETIVVVNVRDRSAAPIEGITVTLTPPAGVTVTSGVTAVSDATGRAEFKLSAGGAVTIDAQKRDPFEAGKTTVTADVGKTTFLPLYLVTKHTPKHRYLWQNNALRPTIYPGRETKLRWFLYEYKVVDLDDPAKIPGDASAKMATKRAQVEADLAKAKAKRDELLKEKKWNEAEAAKKEVLALENELKQLADTEQNRRNFALKEYKQALDGMSHKTLVTAVLDRFEADTSGRHEKWVRYMTVQYSGLRYESAHTSFADPKRLLPLLCRENVADLLADTSKTSPKRLLELAREARKGVADNASKGTGSPYKPSDKDKDPDPGALADMSESEVSDPKNAKKVEQLRKKISNYFEIRSRELSDPLDRPELLGIVQSRNPASPIASRAVSASAWKYMLSLTALRADAGSPDDLVYTDVDPKKPRPTLSDKVWSERAVGKWRTEDVTQWRKHHEKTLEPTMRAVCNEIDEMSLHARGVSLPGGITENAKRTAEKSLGGKLKSPKVVGDLPPHGSIFFATWRTLAETPDTDPKWNDTWHENTANWFDLTTPIDGPIRLGPTDTFDFASTLPGQVGNVRASPGKSAGAKSIDAIQLTWAAVPGATEYHVHAASTEDVAVGTPLATVKEPKFLDKGLTSGTTRHYVVQAHNALGVGPPSAVVGATVDEANDRPSKLGAQARSDGAVVLSWKGTSKAVKYWVYTGTSMPDAKTSPLQIVDKTEAVLTQPAAPLGKKVAYVVLGIDAKGTPIGATSTALAQATIPTGPKKVGGVYTYHVVNFKQKEGGAHPEIRRTYRGTAKYDAAKREYIGTPGTEVGETSPGQPGVLSDVLLWQHEAAVIELDQSLSRDRAFSFETTEPTGVNPRLKPGWNWYVGVVDGQTPNRAELDPFLDRKELELSCDPD